jgi:predicted neutral ceramidase superfamily lipid hydrolase
MVIEKQGYFHRNWKEIVYSAIILSTFIIVTIEVTFLQINQSINDSAANFINNSTWITFFTLLFFDPFSKDTKRIRLIRKSIPLVIPIYALSMGFLYLSYNSVLNQTINEIDYLNRYFIIVLACFFSYGLVYGLFWIQDWRSAKRNLFPVQ